MKESVEQDVKSGKVVAIIRGYEPDVCLRLAEAYLKGGIRAVEVTYVQTDRELWKKTTAAIRAISERFAGQMHVGAGTVLTSEQLRMTRDAGGEFMVAPNVNPALVRECVSFDMAAIPGALTPTEAVDAWTAGASFVKVFPAGCMGPSYLKALKAPLAHIPLLAVGGITPANAADFIKAGCAGVAVSSALTDRALIESGAWDKIAEIARQLEEVTGT